MKSRLFVIALITLTSCKSGGFRDSVSLFDSQEIGGTILDEILYDPSTKDYLPIKNFSHLVGLLSAKLGRPHGALSIKGRSPEADLPHPHHFRNPRILLAYENLLLGHSEIDNITQVISINRKTQRQEFQVVKEGYVYYVERSKCTTCHQNGAGIFPIAPWSELAFLKSPIPDDKSTAKFEKVQKERLGPLPDANYSDIVRFESHVTDSNASKLNQLLWGEFCSSQNDVELCRFELLEFLISFLFNYSRHLKDEEQLHTTRSIESRLLLLTPYLRKIRSQYIDFAKVAGQRFFSAFIPDVDPFDATLKVTSKDRTPTDKPITPREPFRPSVRSFNIDVHAEAFPTNLEHAIPISVNLLTPEVLDRMSAEIGDSAEDDRDDDILTLQKKRSRREETFSHYFSKIDKIRKETDFFRRPIFNAFELEHLLIGTKSFPTVYHGGYPPHRFLHEEQTNVNEFGDIAFINHLVKACGKCHSSNFDPKFLGPEKALYIQIMDHREDILRVLKDGSMPPRDTTHYQSFSTEHRQQIIDELTR